MLSFLFRSADVVAFVRAMKLTRAFRFSKLGSDRVKLRPGHPRMDAVCYLAALLMSALTTASIDCKAALTESFTEPFTWALNLLALSADALTLALRERMASVCYDCTSYVPEALRTVAPVPTRPDSELESVVASDSEVSSFSDSDREDDSSKRPAVEVEGVPTRRYQHSHKALPVCDVTGLLAMVAALGEEFTSGQSPACIAVCFDNVTQQLAVASRSHSYVVSLNDFAEVARVILSHDLRGSRAVDLVEVCTCLRGAPCFKTAIVWPVMHGSGKVSRVVAADTVVYDACNPEDHRQQAFAGTVDVGVGHCV
jgi:hypothetical protein